MASMIQAAAINFEIRPVLHRDDFYQLLTSSLRSAASGGAELIVLPEYTIAPLYTLVTAPSEAEAPSLLVPFAQEYVHTLEAASRSLGVTIVGGSFFSDSFGGITNVCPITTPHAPTRFQVKNQLVTYEKKIQKLSKGTHLELLDDRRIGVLICYDSEFPEYCRSLCEQGMQVLCVPSSTETTHGFHRVRYSCLARAIENQIYVIHAALVGSIGKEPHPESYGSSAIISPCAPEFPEGPLLAETMLNHFGIATAALDMSRLEIFRNEGEVMNFKDWQTLATTSIPSRGPLQA
jgi:predicted amidohydrolase